VEVVIGIKRAKGGFGFTLRNDNNRFAHQGMLDLLRDVFNSDAVVEVEYNVDPGEFGKVNGKILRVTRRGVRVVQFTPGRQCVERIGEGA